MADPVISTDELRAKLDQGMIYAPSKWAFFLDNITAAYAKAYDNQKGALEDIDRAQRAEAEAATLLASIVIPSLLGGLVGAVISGKSGPALKALTDDAARFKWGVAIDTMKTIDADITKAATRAVYQNIIETSGWKPTAMSPAEFGARLKAGEDSFIARAADALNDSKLGKIKATYRDVVCALYYGPFIRQAPRADECWTIEELTPVLEVFLWVEWSTHRDVKYWLEKISRVVEPQEALTPGDWGMGKYYESFGTLKHLNPILERLDYCGVDQAYDTMGIPGLKGYRFLNLLWLPKITGHYRGTLLGDLLGRLGPGNHEPFPMVLRPKSYPLM